MAVSPALLSDADRAGVLHISAPRLPEVGDLTMAQLGSIAADPAHPMRQLVDAECAGRPDPRNPGERIRCPQGARFKCMAYFSEVSACDECRAEYLKLIQEEAQRNHWEANCPEDFRDTSTKHPSFPRDIHKSLADWLAGESLFLYGPSGAGKTRVAILLLKRALLNGYTIGFLWPEEMKDAAKSLDRLKRIHWFGRHDVLLMDDALLTGAQDEKIADFMKDLIDYMMRHKRVFIVTSQIGGDDYMEQANKFGNLTKTDKERIEALLRRLRDKCRVVPFAKPEPAAGEVAF